MKGTPAGMSGPLRSRPAWLVLGIVLSSHLVGGSRRGSLSGGVEFAPSVPDRPQGPPPSRPIKPAAGPWFVDRARDFGVDVITRCGSPDKPSILHALGSGVALFDY